ncbi:UNVERIFIED_CONTAM: hypothetical protein FKN15_030901 [Acipenser sinensis]
MRKSDERKICTEEMSWLRGILGVSRMQKIKNEIIRKKLKQETTLLQKIQERRLRWFSHVSGVDTDRITVTEMRTEGHRLKPGGRRGLAA